MKAVSRLRTRLLWSSAGNSLHWLAILRCHHLTVDGGSNPDKLPVWRHHFPNDIDRLSDAWTVSPTRIPGLPLAVRDTVVLDTVETSCSPLPLTLID